MNSQTGLSKKVNCHEIYLNKNSKQITPWWHAEVAVSKVPGSILRVQSGNHGSGQQIPSRAHLLLSTSQGSRGSGVWPCPLSCLPWGSRLLGFFLPSGFLSLLGRGSRVQFPRAWLGLGLSVGKGAGGPRARRLRGLLLHFPRGFLDPFLDTHGACSLQRH